MLGEVGVGEPCGDRDRRETWEREWVAGIEDGDAVGSRRHVLEQAGLGGEVSVAAAVQLEMLGGDPREHRGAELHAVGTVHLERVRRGLERDVRATGVADAGELSLQLGCLGGRLPRRVGDHAVPGAAIDGGDRRGGDPRRTPRVPEERRRCGLAVGPGDAGDAERPAGVVVEGGGEVGERQPRVGDDDNGYRAVQRRRRDALGDDRDRATRDRIGDESMAVSLEPGDRDEEGARAHGREVGVDRGDLEARRVGGSAASIPAAPSRAASGRAACVGCTVAVYGRVAAIMAGKKQKRSGERRSRSPTR